MEKQYVKFHAIGIKGTILGPRNIFQIDYAKWKFQRQGYNESKRWHLELFHYKRMWQIIFKEKILFSLEEQRILVWKNRTFLQFDQSLFWHFVAEAFFSKSYYKNRMIVQMVVLCFKNDLLLLFPKNAFLKMLS